MAIQSKDLSGKPASTVIGESILVNGKLEGDEDLTVRGRVHGSITLTRTLIVEPTGVVKADATVRNAMVSGVVIGNITASESVHLTREGRMVGDIASPRVIIVEGAAFRGHIDMGAVTEPRLGERPAARPQVSPALARPVVRPIAPPRPPPPPAPRSESRTPAPPPPALPPPPPPSALRPSAETEAPDAAPVALAMGKKKVVVKRKK